MKLIIFFLTASFSLLSSAEVPTTVFTAFEQNQNKLFENNSALNNESFSQVEKNILKKWNEVRMSSKKTLVNYYQDESIRLIIDYEKGLVKLEAIGNNKANIKNVLNKILDEVGTTNSLLSTDLLTNKKTSKLKLIDELMKEVIINDKDVKKIKTKLHISMLSDQLKTRANRYLKLIAKWAKANDLDPELVIAIIRHESAFNPRAESHIPAYGLMQVVPKYAGKDVMITVMDHDAEPTKEKLFDPETNIFFGTTYLKMLTSKFSKLTSDKNQLQSMIIASYNWGPQRILNAIKNKKIKINEPDLYGQIIKIAPVETKNYLKVVTELRAELQNKG